MTQNSDAYIANVLLNLKDLLEDHDLTQHLSAISENYYSAEVVKKAKEDAAQFIDFYHKNILVQDPEKAKVQSNVPLRVYMDGVFDMVHSGHFNAIRQAKQLCDVLVIGVVSDEEVIHHKGPPIMPLSERAEIIGACKWVDEVATDQIPYNPSIDLIDKLDCPFVAHGDDLALSADGTDCYSIIKNAGRMKTFKRTHGISTTDIVGRLLLVAKNPILRRQSSEFKNLGGDDLLTSKTINSAKHEESKEGENAQPKVQLLQTTRRIRQFSSGKEPKATDKVVYIGGSFDLLHIGHVRILKKAKEQGDFLIVGIHDDDTIEQNKGPHYPVLHLQERVLNVLALKYVDEVIIGAPWIISENLIKNFNIQVVVEGSVGPVSHLEAQKMQQNDPFAYPKQLGIFKQLESDNKMTTQTIIERIIENRTKLSQAHDVKKKKLDDYYKSLAGKDVQET